MSKGNMQKLLSRDNSMILRGVAILFIMLHNFLHVSLFGFSKENEMAFSEERAHAFFDAITNGSNFWGEFFSHLGWIGVPVFVFLTGYGIALKPPIDKGRCITYIKRNYLKLLALMLPAVLFFAGIDILKGELWPGLVKRFSYLTMLTNFAYPYLSCDPGVYWYFGLTFQFYLLWALVGRRMNGKNLLAWSVILLAALYALAAFGFPQSLSIFRHCFTGWFPVFAIGVWLGISNKGNNLVPKNIWMELILFFVLFGVVLLMGKWMLSWVFIPIIALVWFIVMGLLLLRTRFFSIAFRWLGNYSACIFVCHPIARLIVRIVVCPRLHNIIALVVIYFILAIGIAFLYDKLYKWILNKFKTSIA